MATCLLFVFDYFSLIINRPATSYHNSIATLVTIPTTCASSGVQGLETKPLAEKDNLLVCNGVHSFVAAKEHHNRKLSTGPYTTITGTFHKTWLITAEDCRHVLVGSFLVVERSHRVPRESFLSLPFARCYCCCYCWYCCCYYCCYCCCYHLLHLLKGCVRGFVLDMS